MVELSIILPVFNEEKNISLIVQKYKSLSKNNNLELIFVEDSGSKDNTRQQIELAEKNNSFVRKLFTNERGYGISIYNGLKVAKGRYLCWTHADMQTNPEDTVRALRIIKKEGKCTFIKGNRKKRNWFDSFFTLGMSFFETFLLGELLYDINAQPNLFERSFLEKLKTPPHDFSFDLFAYYTAKKSNMKIIRFPVLFTQRIHGESSWNNGISSKIKFIKRTVKFSLKLNKRFSEKLTKRYLNLLKELFKLSFVKFCLIGGISTIINYTTFYLIYTSSLLNYILASATGYITGVFISFYFNQKITFNSQGNTFRKANKYILLYISTLGVSLVLLAFFVKTFSINPLFANIITIIITTILNFFGCKLFVFRD